MWVEVSSLLINRAVEHVEILLDQEGRDGGGGILPLFPGHQADWWVPSYSQPQWTQHVSSCFEVPHGDPLLQGLHRDWWIVALELNYAYLHVPIHPILLRYLWFVPRNLTREPIVYQWKVLPFGLATAPRVLQNSWLL